jgi:tagatose-6-phosphate ketose/aldose isomerase
LPELDETAQYVAGIATERMAILASALTGIAREASLKLLELSGGRVVTLCETYLTKVTVCLVSADKHARCYEEDLLEELREQRLGRLVGITRPRSSRAPVGVEIVFAQLLGYHLSLRFGLDPDDPSPHGVINRVVQGVRIHG